VASERMKEIEEAFDWEDPYDVILALVHLTVERCEAAGLPYSSLSQGEKTALHVNWFDSEIANGGLHQLFTNSTGDYWPEILQSLGAVGATSTVALFEIALSVFPDNRPSVDRMDRCGQLEDAGGNARDTLHLLSREYYEQDEYLYTLAVEYLKTRKSDFL
jgi:hypothetical protein